MKVQLVPGRLFSVLLCLALILSLVPFSSVAADTPTELYFSKYIEGSSNNKALEIYNGTGSAIDLSAGGYNIQMFFNGSATAGVTINLAGTVASGDVFVLAHASASATILAAADQTSGVNFYNGDDAVVLRKGTTIIDAIGQIGFDPGTEWGTGLTSTADNTMRRKSTICGGDITGSDVFDPSLEWDGFATDTFDGLGTHTAACSGPDSAPSVSSTNPSNGATDFSTSGNITVTFSEPVNLAVDWFTLSCSSSGSHSAVVTGGTASFTVNPDVDFVGGESCTFTVKNAGVSDQDTNDPPDTMAFDYAFSFSVTDFCALSYTPIPQIQGDGVTVAITGTVTTKGVVVGDYEGASPALRGFFIQDSAGDGNPATSDGIFVFEGSNLDTVSLGDFVVVTGTAGENQGQSQISVGTIVKCGTGTVTPTDITFPVASADYLERYEGMLVRLPQTLYVTEHYQLGRFGQVVLSANARLEQPTHVTDPGAPALALQAQNDLNRIILDDASQTQNPDPILFARGGLPLSASNTLRGGDTATGIVGVLNYTWAGNSASGNAYRVRPINALNGSALFEPANPRPVSAPAVGGSLKVVGMNLLNFFNTFIGCTNGVGGTATDCRGANSQSELDRQVAKTIAAINAIDPDVLGVNEIENDGYGADSALQFLVDQLNNASAPGTYALIDADTRSGQTNALGTDAIKVAMIYKPGKVTPVGQTAVLNTTAFVNGGDSLPRNRASLAQAFEQNSTGARLIVNLNHLKSKGSACDVPDLLDGQGNCNLVRVAAANELVTWLATNPTGTGDPDILMLGDYNSYAMENPITTIKNAGYLDLIQTRIGAGAYSYVFDGQWGYLDYAFGSTSLGPQVAGVGEYHINADEPSVLDYNTEFKSAGQIVSLYAPDLFRISDHDPVIVGLNLVNSVPLADAGGPYTVNEGESVKLTATGSDPDGTPVTFSWDLDQNGTFETTGQSVLYLGVNAPNVYTVTVKVTDQTGLFKLAQAEVTVNSIQPAPPFIYRFPIIGRGY